MLRETDVARKESAAGMPECYFQLREPEALSQESGFSARDERFHPKKLRCDIKLFDNALPGSFCIHMRREIQG